MANQRYTKYDLKPIFVEMEQRFWSRALLANKANLSRPTVHRAERGLPVTAMTVTKLAKAVGRTREEFIKPIEDDEPIAPPFQETPEVARV